MEACMRQLLKGNEAVIHGAIAAGCGAYFGYPITPASEVAEAAALLLPKAGGVFLQAESEVASIQMIFGASGAGVRAMSASSGPGISLMQEGISYMAGAELPAVIVDIMRAGPGLGNIGPEQSDYFQNVKGGGHGNYRTIVVAPNSVQEMCDLTMLAFELADRYRNPAVLLADGILGQMMEAIELPERVTALPEKPWAVTGNAETRHNLITSIYLEPELQEAHIGKMEKKYRTLEERECRWEEFRLEDFDVLLVAYGIMSRLARAAVEMARAEGVRAGLLRPITLYPFPSRRLHELAAKAVPVLALELSIGQMVEDVRLAVNGVAPVKLFNRTGGMVPTAEDIVEAIKTESQCVGNYA
jgi:2-oxoisovalerate ferredoxin oxidoreductase alpha subunit